MDDLVEYLCIIQARLNSSRLPAKIMLDLAGKTLLERVHETVSRSVRINKIVIATSNEKTDNIVELKLKSLGIEFFKGDLNNVLKRFYDVAQKYKAKNIVRITADNPLMDSTVIDNLIIEYEKKDVEYSMFSNGIYGLSAEVFSFKSLAVAYKNVTEDFDKEHVTPYIRNNCKTHITEIEKKFRKPDIRATIDTLEDYIKMQEFYLYCDNNGIVANMDNFIKRKSLENIIIEF